MADVVTWNDSEANLVKEPTVFNDFTYDTQTDEGCLNKFNDVEKIINDISEDITNISARYSELQSLYNEFTDYNENMDTNKRKLESSVEAIRGTYTQLLESMNTQVEELQKDDEELITDLDNINEMISTEEDALEDSQKVSTPSVDSTPTDNTTPTDTPTKEQTKEIPSETDLGDIADKVIAGKYGTGDQRKKALADAGYDPDAVQDIVNKKLNGKYKGDTSSNPTPTPTIEQPAATTPVVETPTTEAGFMPSSGLGSSMVNAAAQYLNTPYVYGGNGNGGIDCSALTQKAAAAIGVTLPRTTGGQAKCGVAISLSDVRAGDLIFTNGGGHVVMCTGRDANGNIKVIGASSVAGKVIESTLQGKVVQARRIV